MERWVPISGFEWRYEVSDLGRVRSLQFKGRQRSVPLVLRDYAAGAGYRFVGLFDGEHFHQTYVHRAVLTAFTGPPAEGVQGAHLDGCKTNNVLANLVWATPLENHAHKVLHGRTLRGERGSNVRLTADQVRLCRRRYVAGDRTNGARALAREFGVCQPHMSAILSGKRWAYLDAEAA